MNRRGLASFAAVGATCALVLALVGADRAPTAPFHPGLLAPGAAGSSGAGASGPGQAGTADRRPIVSAAVRHDTSKPLRTIVPEPPVQGQPDADAEAPLPLPGRAGAAPPRGGHDPVVQSAIGAATASAPIVNFEGVANVNGVLPPDTNGDIGPNEYIQWVNLSFAIYDRSGTKLYGPAAGSSLWKGFTGPCETTNDGDPIAQYDQLADRWVMSQFALPNFDGTANSTGPFYVCIAVSTTADPLGTWSRYAFKISDTKLDDYPHLGVWPDAYYLSINQFNIPAGTWGGQGAVAFDRTQMLAGGPATMVSFDLFSTDPNLGGMLPSDLDGAAPPDGAPNVYVEADDSANGYPSDRLDLWDFHVDWTTPANSTFTHDVSLTTAAMDTNLCGYARSCIPQPPFVPKNSTQGLDALSDRIMYRLQYRNFGSYQTLVTTNTVDVNGLDHAGIRWFEVRNSGSGWAIRQQGTWAPDSNDRWLGSAAMNGNGDIAMGYSVSSSTTFPSIRYTGRLAADALGAMTQGEGTVMAGSGSQTNGAARWGDYSMLAVDPLDDCTFWYTNEYLAVTSDHSWQTRIGAFRLPGCGSDSTPPSVVSFAPTTASPTNAATISYSLTFSEIVTGLASGDFSRSGSAAGCSVGAPAGSGTTYTIAITGCSSGTLALTLAAGSVVDGGSNAGPASSSTASTVTIDRTGPSAIVTAPATPTNVTTLTYAIGFNEPASGFAAADVVSAGTATGCVIGAPTGSGTSYSVALTGCSAGSVVLTLKAGSVTDALGNAGPASDVAAASVLIDRSAPTTTAPVASLRAGVPLSGSGMPTRLTWSATDSGGAGPATYDVARSYDGAGFTIITTGLTSPTAVYNLASGHTYRYEIRTHDRAGNVGGWAAGPTLHPLLLQQTSSSILYHGTWTTATYASFSGGSVRYATAAGASASYTFTGRGVAFVTTRAASRGSVKVYIDGVLVSTVSCYAASTTFRYVAYSRAWTSSGTHTIKLVVVGTSGRPRVDLDAIEVLR